MAVKTRRERETLRQSFEPSRVRLLFVGESAPASGRFFYSRDSGLYRAMRSAFQNADPSINDDNFLTIFQASGYYLIDLSQEPIDHLDPLRRRTMRIRGEQFLAGELARLKPEIVAALLRSVTGNVANAAAQANWKGPILSFSYPGRWVRYRDNFIDALVPVIRQLRADEPRSPS